MYITFDEQEKQLKPCPLCGASARIISWQVGLDCEKTEIRCTGCGLALNWEQRFILRGGVRVNIEPNFRTAWNRRTEQ